MVYFKKKCGDCITDLVNFKINVSGYSQTLYQLYYINIILINT